MESSGYWVGLDCGFEKTAVCVIDDAGRILAEETCDTQAPAVADILQQFPLSEVRLISVEAGVGTHMVRQLNEMRYPVRVFEVRKSNKFLTVRRHKTDANDANGLAELGRIGRSVGSEVYVKSLECQNIRTQLVARRSLLQQRMKLDALIQSLVRLHGGKLQLRYATGALSLDVGPQLARLEADGIDVEADIWPLVRIAETLREQVKAFDKRFYVLAAKHPVCANLMTVPGIGPITALSFYSAIGDPHRFTRNRDVGPYLGLTPYVHQSGVTSRQGRISRWGSKMTRTHLVSGATVLLGKARTECALRTWGHELAGRIGRAKARIAVARKMAVIMLQMWKTQSPFDALRS